MTASISAECLPLQELLAGRYSIERELGRGGMGIVLLARDVALDRPVAIKLLPPHLAAHPDERDRFLAEAQTAAGLSHPNIVPIHVVEARGELVFFVMGYVDGETLRDRVKRAGPLAPRLAIKLLQEVAWALGYAHQCGVIHRSDLPHVLKRLEAGAEALRAGGDTGERLTEVVAALEHLRLALVKRQTGLGPASDLTVALERARAIGDHFRATAGSGARGAGPP
jgi:hypothetical protein